MPAPAAANASEAIVVRLGRGTTVACGGVRARQRRAGFALELGYVPDRLERDPGRHLRLAGGAVGEHDRDLADREARQDRAVGDLDLEHVTLSPHAWQIDRLEHFAPDAFEAAGQIVD